MTYKKRQKPLQEPENSQPDPKKMRHMRLQKKRKREEQSTSDKPECKKNETYQIAESTGRKKKKRRTKYL